MVRTAVLPKNSSQRCSDPKSKQVGNKKSLCSQILKTSRLKEKANSGVQHDYSREPRMPTTT